MPAKLTTVFLSYSHRDERLKERLATHLAVLRDRLEVWDDRKLEAGEDWRTGIARAMASARVAVLLISADYLSSKFVLEEEVPRLLQRRAEEGVKIVPVLLKSCAWQQIPWLAKMQLRPADARPLMQLEGDAREKAYAAIAMEILGLVEQSFVKDPPSPSYADEASQEVAEALEEAVLQYEGAKDSGGDTEASLQAMLDLKRRLREEGQLKPGDFLADGRFRLLEILGRGGFATVFKAYDRRDHQQVAVKVLHPQYAQDRSRRQRFFRGARKMSELQSPGVVRVIEPRGSDGGYHFFVMEYVESGDLKKAVTSGQISGVEGLGVLADIAEALDLAHRQGMIHRDVKPANILLTKEGKAKLTDFDLVRAFDTTAGTRTGSMLGTFLYIAPEAMMGAENASKAADIYSLAMCAAFVLNGAEIPATFMRRPDAFFDKLQAPAVVKRALGQATAWEAEKRQGSTLQLWREVREGLPKRPKRQVKNGGTEYAETASKVPRRLASGPAGAGIWKSWKDEDEFGRWTSFEIHGVVQRMRWILPGTFTMGSPQSELGRFKDEGPTHSVTLTEGFWLADTPCTQALWEAVMGDNPSHFKSPRRPVENVSWKDCQQFIERLNDSMPALELRLPTEAQWEYACRAGTTTATWAGELDSELKSSILDPIAWHHGNRREGTQEVAQKKANPWGLFDMLGNVYEWCLDGHRTYRAKPVTDPVVPMRGTDRVFRGGSWFVHARFVRAAYRGGFEPGYRYSYLGFRLSRGPVRGAP